MDKEGHLGVVKKSQAPISKEGITIKDNKQKFMSETKNNENPLMLDEELDTVLTGSHQVTPHQK